MCSVSLWDLISQFRLYFCQQKKKEKRKSSATHTLGTSSKASFLAGYQHIPPLGSYHSTTSSSLLTTTPFLCLDISAGFLRSAFHHGGSVFIPRVKFSSPSAIKLIKISISHLIWILPSFQPWLTHPLTIQSTQDELRQHCSPSRCTKHVQTKVVGDGSRAKPYAPYVFSLSHHLTE